MQKFIQWLVIILLAQLILVLGISWIDDEQASKSGPAKLFDIALAKTEKIVVSDGKGSVELVRNSDNKWQLATFEELPADKSKLESVIDKLTSAKVTWPVATTESSHERFEVSDNKFQRRLSFYDGDQLITEAFLGTSPGFRKLHVRKAGDDAVYSIELNHYDFPVNDKDWLDKSLLSLSEVKSIVVDNLQLKKERDNWIVMEEGNQVDNTDHDRISDWITDIKSLRVSDVSKSLEDLESRTSTELTVNDQLRYQLFNNDSETWVKRSDYPVYFKISNFLFNKVADVKVAEFISQDSNEINSEEITAEESQASELLNQEDAQIASELQSESSVKE